MLKINLISRENVPLSEKIRIVSGYQRNLMGHKSTVQREKNNSQKYKKKSENTDNEQQHNT